MKKVFIIFFLCLLHKELIAQNPPGEPNIAWMEPEYQLSDGNVDITFVWDMWWGEKGGNTAKYIGKGFLPFVSCNYTKQRE